MKLCSDCKHFGMFNSCLRKEKVIGVDPIHGSPLKDGNLCARAERSSRWLLIPFVPVPIPPFWRCGKGGKYWEPREEEDDANQP